MLGQLLASADSITEGLRILNRFIEFKKDFEPFSKDIFHETVGFLQETTKGFDPQALVSIAEGIYKQYRKYGRCIRDVRLDDGAQT